MKISYALFCCTLMMLILLGCRTPVEDKQEEVAESQEDLSSLTVAPNEEDAELPDLSHLADTMLVDILLMDPTFILDIKYATADNFTNQVLYDCASCMLRKVVADSLVAAHQVFKEKGYFIKLFDCYRPNSVQWQMWDIVSDPRYVADPAKGSMHNRGSAVDLTLVSMETGEEVDMGSAFDHFGPTSHHVYTGHPASINESRALLKDNLARFGFEHITSEWWHYSFKGQNFPIANSPFTCEQLAP